MRRATGASGPRQPPSHSHHDAGAPHVEAAEMGPPRGAALASLFAAKAHCGLATTLTPMQSRPSFSAIAALPAPRVRVHQSGAQAATGPAPATPKPLAYRTRPTRFLCPIPPRSLVPTKSARSNARRARSTQEYPHVLGVPCNQHRRSGLTSPGVRRATRVYDAVHVMTEKQYCSEWLGTEMAREKQG